MIRKILLLTTAFVIFGGIANANATAVPSPTPTTSADKPKRALAFRPNKDQIKQVQTMLKDKKLYTGEATGVYNDDTRTGIRSFQKSSGLRETGTLNRATLEKFGVTLTDKQKEIPVTASSLTPAVEKKPKTTKTGDTGAAGTKPKKVIFRATVDQIKSAQKLLKSKSMYSGEETGKLDDATRAGLKKFQEANGVKVTGTLNAATLDKMGIPLTDKQKADAAAATPGN